VLLADIVMADPKRRPDGNKHFTSVPRQGRQRAGVVASRNENVKVSRSPTVVFWQRPERTISRSALLGVNRGRRWADDVGVISSASGSGTVMARGIGRGRGRLRTKARVHLGGRQTQPRKV
jgi:hypothetical protein